MNSSTSKSVLAAGLAAAALVVPLVASAPAQASGGDREIRRSGSCSGSTDWKLKAKADDGRIEVEGEIDSNRVGQTWRWKLRHNGRLTASGTRVTRAPSGSFEVNRRIVNLSGTDKIVFRARNPRTDEVCRGVIRF